METIQVGGRDVPVRILRKVIKHLYLRIDQDGIIVITAHPKVTLAAIASFVANHEAAIVKRLHMFDQRERLESSLVRVFGNVVPLVIDPSIKRPNLQLDGLRMPLVGDETKRLQLLESLYQDAVVQKAKLLFDNWRWHFSPALLEGLQFKSKRTKSQHGSCHRQKRYIQLSSVLGRFPVLYLEAILVHELVHLEITGHGTAFYSRLLALMPDYRIRMRGLRQLMKTIEV
jgi:predicted metal-dependent hydrolase